MKLSLFAPLSVLLLAVSASALTQGAPPVVKASGESNAFDVERRVEQLGREEARLKLELDASARESELLKARTLARGRAYTRLARAGLLPIGGGFDAFVSHAARLERLHRSLARDLELERRTAERRTELAKQLASLSAQRGLLEEQQRTLSQAQAALSAARDRDQAFERAFMGGGVDDHTAVYGAPSSSLGADSAGFAAAKGSLPFPISGRSEIRSTRKNGGGPGLSMRAAGATVVRAVFPGRVAFADTYADYGRTVILDHGGGYYTVSANLSEIEVKVGDEIKGGARIATLGGGGTAGSTLYFEVRIGQETADPAEWFGI